MKCQILFSRKNISKCYLLKFLPSVQSVNEYLQCLFPLEVHRQAKALLMSTYSTFVYVFVEK